MPYHLLIVLNIVEATLIWILEKIIVFINTVEFFYNP